MTAASFMLEGDIVARTLRNRGSLARPLMLTPTAFGTARFKLGADDYLSKPFDYKVLLARLRAIACHLKSPDGGCEFNGIRL